MDIIYSKKFWPCKISVKFDTIISRILQGLNIIGIKLSVLSKCW